MNWASTGCEPDGKIFNDHLEIIEGEPVFQTRDSIAIPVNLSFTSSASGINTFAPSIEIASFGLLGDGRKNKRQIRTNAVNNIQPAKIPFTQAGYGCRNGIKLVRLAIKPFKLTSYAAQRRRMSREHRKKESASAISFREAQSAPLPLIGGARAEPVKDNGEASAGDKLAVSGASGQLIVKITCLYGAPAE